MWGVVTDVNASLGIATVELTEDSAAAQPPVGDGEGWSFGKFDMREGGDAEDEDETAMVPTAADRTMILELDTLLDKRLAPTRS
jgi:hypothetical protein